jgi:hypothetical protein
MIVPKPEGPGLVELLLKENSYAHFHFVSGQRIVPARVRDP